MPERVAASGRGARVQCRESLANLHLDHGNFEKSLDYQRAWLRDSEWVGRACPEVCALPEPGPS